MGTTSPRSTAPCRRRGRRPPAPRSSVFRRRSAMGLRRSRVRSTPTAPPSGRRSCGGRNEPWAGRRSPPSSSRTKPAGRSRTRRPAARKPRSDGTRRCVATGRTTPSSPGSSAAGCGASSPSAGMRAFPRSRQEGRRSPPARHRRRSCRASPRPSPSSSAGRRTSTRPASPGSRGKGTSRPPAAGRASRARSAAAGITVGGTSTSAFASTRWGRSRWGWPATAGCGRLPARSSSSPTTCGPRSGSPRSWAPPSCSCSPTTRSPLARTAQPTSRWSTSPRCVLFPT